MRRMGNKPDFFGMKPMPSLRVVAGNDVTFGAIPMALRPFLGKLSLVTAYLAFAFVGAIVLGVF